LQRRRDSTRLHHPQLFEEYRSASKSVSSWQELRRRPMKLAELQARMRALEERLQLEPGTLVP
jgi:hypothetical protein